MNYGPGGNGQAMPNGMYRAAGIMTGVPGELMGGMRMVGGMPMMLGTPYPQGQGPLAGQPAQLGANGLYSAPKPEGPEEHGEFPSLAPEFKKWARGTMLTNLCFLSMLARSIEGKQFLQLNTAEETQYSEWWADVSEGEDVAPAVRVTAFLSRAPNVSKSQLRAIWDVADSRREGCLDRDGFLVGIRLLALAQRGAQLSLMALRNFVGIQLIPSVSAPTPKPAPAPSVSPPAGSDAFPWTVPAQLVARYDRFFAGLDASGAGVIDGAEGAAFFSKSGLPRSTLRAIWRLADVTADGRLDREEFRQAIHLVTGVKNGRITQEQFPPRLHPSALWLRAEGELPPTAVRTAFIAPPAEHAVAPEASPRVQPPASFGRGSSPPLAGPRAPAPGVAPLSHSSPARPPLGGLIASAKGGAPFVQHSPIPSPLAAPHVPSPGVAPITTPRAVEQAAPGSQSGVDVVGGQMQRLLLNEESTRARGATSLASPPVTNIPDNPHSVSAAPVPPPPPPAPVQLPAVQLPQQHPAPFATSAPPRSSMDTAPVDPPAPPQGFAGVFHAPPAALSLPAPAPPTSLQHPAGHIPPIAAPVTPSMPPPLDDDDIWNQPSPEPSVSRPCAAPLSVLTISKTATSAKDSTADSSDEDDFWTMGGNSLGAKPTLGNTGAKVGPGAGTQGGASGAAFDADLDDWLF